MNTIRQVNTEDRARLLPIVVDSRLLNKAICYLHASRENRSIYGGRLHYSSESVVRENIKCEIGFTTTQYQQLAKRFIDSCMVCSIIKQRHPDKSRGSRVPLMLEGKPYQHISIDTLGLGKVRLSKDTRNLLSRGDALKLILAPRLLHLI